MAATKELVRGVILMAARKELIRGITLIKQTRRMWKLKKRKN